MQLRLPLTALQFSSPQAALPVPSRRIYCNRSLRLDNINWVGFDMDYTLAIYRQEEMDRLSIEATARKLVERGFPEELATMSFRTDFAVRGLLVDKKLGNVLKMDRYKYVKRAYHGTRELSRQERRRDYHSRRLRPGSRRYHWVDTLYALSEVAVFSAAVDVLEATGKVGDFSELFESIRECIDEAHRDGTILNQIKADLPRYVARDDELRGALHKLRSSGKRLFLLTNSNAEYTGHVLSYLLDGGDAPYAHWRQYFDLIVTSAKKPRFFTHREPFLDESGNETTRLDREGIYAGGNFEELEARLGVRGDQVLYVGDHIYGDVLRAKKHSAWRTIMIIQEMDAEMEALGRCTEAVVQADTLEELRYTLLSELRARQSQLKQLEKLKIEAGRTGQRLAPELEAERQRERRATDKLRARIRSTETELFELEDAIDGAFHPYWGSLFKAGSEVSSFGDQVEEYACLYTDRVSNLLAYSPMHYFRSHRDRMPHER